MKELMFLGFILTAPLTSSASDEQNAYRYASEAFYQESGMDAVMQEYVNKKVPKPLQKVAGNAAVIVQTIQTRRLTYSWSF